MTVKHATEFMIDVEADTYAGLVAAAEEQADAIQGPDGLTERTLEMGTVHVRPNVPIGERTMWCSCLVTFDYPYRPGPTPGSTLPPHPIRNA